MKSNVIFTGCAGLAVLLAGCAKSEKSEPYEDEQRYVEAWMSVNYPEIQPDDLGIYILEDEPGTGEELDEQIYVIVNYTISDMDGTVSSTTSKTLSQQLGTYEAANYYGTEVWIYGYDNLPPGVEDMLKGMKIGGSRTALIPAWLMGSKRYSKPSDYLKHSSSDNSTAIYSVELVGITDDIYEVETDSMAVYSKKYLEGIDSTSYGFYYKQLKAPVDTTSFPSDTSVYINYIGRLLNGQVFDTTIKDTAKFYNIYSTSKTYQPAKITWGDSYSDLTLSADSSSDGSSVITGFSMTLWEMRSYEKAVGMFYSAYGYSYSGSGSTIPAFAPLVFEIEMVDEPDDWE